MPPYLPSGPVLHPVTHVLTTKLVLASNAYGVPSLKQLWRVLSRVVVETCDEVWFCCIVLVRPWTADEAFE